MLGLVNRTRGHAELVQPQPEQDRNSLRHTSQFAAHANPLSLAVHQINGLLDQPYHRRVQRLVKSRHTHIPAVHRQRVLCEIVRSQAEGVRCFRKHAYQNNPTGGGV